MCAHIHRDAQQMTLASVVLTHITITLDLILTPTLTLTLIHIFILNIICNPPSHLPPLPPLTVPKVSLFEPSFPVTPRYSVFGSAVVPTVAKVAKAAL